MLCFLLEDAKGAGPGLLLFLRSKFGNRRLANEGPPLHAAVVLRRRERVRASDFGERDAAVESRRLRRADLERIEPDSSPNPPDALTTVAKRERDDAVRHAGEDPHSKLERASRVIETHQVPVRKTLCFGGLRAHQR